VVSRDVPPAVNEVPTPQPGPGSVVIKVLVAGVVTYMRDVLNGKRKYPFPTPIIPGASAIARVAAVGPDATVLKGGELVFYDCTTRGRDNPANAMLAGISAGPNAASSKLMEGEWRNSTYAEYARVPLENCYVLDEARLLGSPREGGLGYKIEYLSYFSLMMVSFGGLADIDIKSGETIVIAPATGAFGGAAVVIALAMGARVIAMGRNKEKLDNLTTFSDRVRAVQIANDVETDLAALRKFGRIDAFFDISPPEAENSTHIKSCILALREGGRVSLMGGQKGDLAIPTRAVMRNCLTIKGKWMYDRKDVERMIGMLEIGNFRLGPEIGLKLMGKYGLEDWDAAFTSAEQNVGMGMLTVITP
jgi:threonine dehydrogenase-like Zn-dependent dehydrogenase